MNITHVANPVHVNATRTLDVTDVTDRSVGSRRNLPFSEQPKLP
ncbi:MULTISPECIES: hypothetical protein [Burkholderiaceae]|nr:MULTISPECIES: hypothetical protein [Burkholderiaceae]WMY11112.1 hypothetical protein P3F88_31145 [Paraburkholderia phenoliruptrix]